MSQVDPMTGLPVQPRKGMSGWGKFFLVMAIGSGLMVVVCCGVAGVMMYGGYRMFADAFSQDPAVVRQVADSITAIDVPEGFEPKFSVNMRVPTTNQVLFTCSVFGEQQEQGTLILAQFNSEVASGDDPEALHEQLKEFQPYRDANQQEEIEITKTEEREYTVRGQPARFMISQGKGQKTGKEYVRVLGKFPGKEGPALLALLEEADQYDEAALVKMLESIR